MRKALVIFICILLISQLFILTACNRAVSPNEENPKDVEEGGVTLVSKICTLPNGKTYLEVDGKPYTLIGAQLRVDGLYNRNQSLTDAPQPVTDDELRKYFEKAKELGINTLSLALEWSKIEIEKDCYDFTLVDKLLKLTNDFGLKCEFLWFSTNMCGDGHGFCVPSYIIDDPENYPRLSAENTYYSNMYGDIFYLVLNNPLLMERESLVLTALMEHVDNWNKNNDSLNPLIGIQIHNESDGLLRWRLNQKNLSYGDTPITPKELWQMTLDALDNAGKAVKNANYKIYTRCNITTSFGVGEFPEWAGLGFSPLDILHLEGIDMIGDDPYTTNPTAINSTVKKYSVDGNYPHIAENMGDYGSTPSMILSAYQAGGAYMLYDLATPQYFVYINKGSSYHMDQGILNPDLTYKAHTAQTACIIKGIASMGSILPLISSENFAAFNVLTEQPREVNTQTICTSSLSITYNTDLGGIAFAIEHEGCLYLYSTTACTFTINNAVYVMRGETGYFDGSEFVVEDDAYIGAPISLESGKLMRIRIREIKQSVTSTTCDNV